jgi:TolA-binding protein
MPQPLQYGSGSLIYFQGDPADKVFLLQAGRVSLVYQDIETGGDVHDMVAPGEFFGVKSALGRFPREENALVLQDTTIMAFTAQEFEALVMKNTRIIMKILKVFSNQLRRIHKQVSILTDTDQQTPESGLFNIGEYYLKNKRFFLAKSVFSRYLTYYPSGKNAAQAAKNMEIAESSLGPQPSPGGMGGPAGTGALAGGAAKTYYDAVSLLSQEKHQQAYQLFKGIVDAGGDPEYTAKSAYEIGRCFFQLNKFEDCIKYYTGMITKYPRHPDLGGALFFMGQSHENCGRKDQAMTFYRKVIAMGSGDDSALRIKAGKALAALEGK